MVAMMGALMVVTREYLLVVKKGKKMVETMETKMDYLMVLMKEYQMVFQLAWKTVRKMAEH